LNHPRVETPVSGLGKRDKILKAGTGERKMVMTQN